MSAPSPSSGIVCEECHSTEHDCTCEQASKNDIPEVAFFYTFPRINFFFSVFFLISHAFLTCMCMVCEQITAIERRVWDKLVEPFLSLLTVVQYQGLQNHYPDESWNNIDLVNKYGHPMEQPREIMSFTQILHPELISLLSRNGAYDGVEFFEPYIEFARGAVFIWGGHGFGYSYTQDSILVAAMRRMHNYDHWHAHFAAEK